MLEFNKPKIHQKMLDITLALASLYAATDFFIDQGTQESLNDVVRDMENLTNSVDSLKNEYLTSLQKIVDEDKDTIYGDQTENGLRL